MSTNNQTKTVPVAGHLMPAELTPAIKAAMVVAGISAVATVYHYSEILKAGATSIPNIKPVQSIATDREKFMVEMVKRDFTIELDVEGEFESELTNAMWVGWQAKTASL
jgi:hypothetical protein